MDEEGKRKLLEEIDKEKKERNERIEKAKRKKEEFMRRIENKNKEKIMMIKPGKGIEWINEKKVLWRKYREREKITDEDESEMMKRLIAAIPERELRRSTEKEKKIVTESEVSEKCIGAVPSELDYGMEMRQPDVKDDS